MKIIENRTLGCVGTYTTKQEMGHATRRIYNALFDDHIEFLKFFEQNDTQANRDAVIHTSKLAFWYCKKIKDREEIRMKITDSIYAFWYCLQIDNNPNVRRHITSSYAAYMYCSTIDDDESMWKYITTSIDACDYCMNIKDRECMWKKITDPELINRYLSYVKDRPELLECMVSKGVEKGKNG